MRARRWPIGGRGSRLVAFWRIAQPSLAIGGLAYLMGSVVGLIPFTLQLGVPPGLDTAAYWGSDLDDLYRGARIGARDAFLYSPAFAQALLPMHLLPFEVAYGLWLGVSVAALVWMRVAWTLAFPPVIADLYFGNLHVFYALAIVVGFRVAGTWALPVLTKVVPGIGILWFAFRAEWRPFAMALGVSLVIAAASFIVAPNLWSGWIESLVANASRPTGMRSDAIPLAVRLLLAVAVLFWGARSGRRWTLPVAVFLASPTIWPGSAAVLVAAVSPRLGDGSGTLPDRALDSR